MNISYVLKRAVRRHIPEAWFFPLMTLLKRSNLSEVSPEEALSELSRRLDSIGVDLADKHILEVGSGRFARVALQMMRAGANRVTLVDLYAVALNDPKHRSLLLRDCTEMDLNIDDAMARIRVFGGDISSLPVAVSNPKADIVTSSAVLEHTRDPQRVLASCWEWLRPGGVTTHVIDLRDHVFESPFEMLTFPDRTWDRWLTPKGGFHLNRWRLPDYLDAMQQVGFENIQYEVLDRDRVALRTILPRLNERFRGIDEDELSVLSVHVWAEKPRRNDVPTQA